MARAHSYRITHNNNASEREAIQFLIDSDPRFINPDKESRFRIMRYLGIERRFSRSFDLIMIDSQTNLDDVISLGIKKGIKLIELKTTKKKLPNNPRGFFFGATQNEFDLAEQFKDQFFFCFVSLHEESKSYALKTLDEMENMIRTKRTQYQINLVS